MTKEQRDELRARAVFGDLIELEADEVLDLLDIADERDRLREDKK